MSTALEKETPLKRIKFSKPLPPEKERQRVLTEISRELFAEHKKNAALHIDAETGLKRFDI